MAGRFTFTIMRPEILWELTKIDDICVPLQQVIHKYEIRVTEI